MCAAAGLAPSPATAAWVSANIGQKEDFEEARKKALKLGAKKVSRHVAQVGDMHEIERPHSSRHPTMGTQRGKFLPVGLMEAFSPRETSPLKSVAPDRARWPRRPVTSSREAPMDLLAVSAEQMETLEGSSKDGHAESKGEERTRLTPPEQYATPKEAATGSKDTTQGLKDPRMKPRTSLETTGRGRSQ